MKQNLTLVIRAGWPVFFYAIVLSVVTGLENHGSLLLTGVAAGLTLFLLIPVYRREWQSWDFLPNNELVNISSGDTWRDGLCGISIGVGFGLIANMTLIWTGFTSPGYEQAGEVLFAPDIRWQILLIGFLVPAAEELVFRGLCFGRLREWLDFPVAAVLSSLLFGWFHGNIVQGAYAFLGGLLMAWGYETCHNMKAPYGIHVGSNLLGLLLSMGSIGALFINNTLLQIMGFLAGVTVCIIGGVEIKRKRG